MTQPPRKDEGPEGDPAVPDPPRSIATDLAWERAREHGGAGGEPPDIGARVAKLEAHVETIRADVAVIKKDVADIRVNLATLTERVAHLPGKGFVITATTTTIGIISGLIIFGEKLKSAIGL